MDLTRRACLSLGVAGVLRAQAPDLAPELTALEKRAGGRLGVGILEVASGRMAGHRLDERFAMCSTFKLLLAAVVLKEAERGQWSLDEVLKYSEKDLIANSPVTKANVARGGMRMGEMAEAAQKTSDNTAANLLLRKVGGPAGLTQALRGMGDRVTRLDRYEPEMNRVGVGDVRDTTSPRAMGGGGGGWLGRGGLRGGSRGGLLEWMRATETGQKRLRAAWPKEWRAGDKTGSMWGGPVTDKINDVAIAWPRGEKGGAVVIACYYDTGRISQEIRDEDQAVVAEVGRIAARMFGA